MLGHKTHLNIYKRIKIIQCLLLDDSDIKLAINKRKTIREPQNTWRLNDILLNNTQVKEEISSEILKYFKLNENENATFQILWTTGKAVLRRVLIALNIC